jgi:hypothetical protein
VCAGESTPLHLAARGNHTAVLQVLLDGEDALDPVPVDFRTREYSFESEGETHL